MYKFFLEKDASLVEVNPLIITETDKLLCLDAKVNFDDNALYRHPEIEELRDENEEDEYESEEDESERIQNYEYDSAEVLLEIESIVSRTICAQTCTVKKEINQQ